MALWRCDMNNNSKKERKEIIISDDRGFKGVWIPERLYLTREFSPNEKFVLIEIYSLTKDNKRRCFASNKHFADFVGLKENSIQKMLLKFERAGYIKRIYEYRDGTKEIQNRILVLTDKFYKSFINEHEETDSNDMEKIQHGSGNKSSDHMEKIPQGGGFNVGDKYNNDKYNNRLSDTDLSNPKEEKTLTNVNAKVKTSLSERKQMPKSAKQKYLDMKSNEINMLNRVYNICQENYDEPIADEIYNTIEHYFEKYTEKTDKIHPILTDNTLRDIIERMANFNDTEYEHFERVIETQGQFIKAVDAFFDTDFGNRTGYQTNWNLPHFMSDGVLDRLMQRIAEY